MNLDKVKYNREFKEKSIVKSFDYLDSFQIFRTEE